MRRRGSRPCIGSGLGRLSPTWDMSQCLETLLIVTTVRALPAGGGWGPGMLPNTLQFTGKPHTAKDAAPSNVTSAEREKPAIRHRPARAQKPHSILNKER